MSEGFAASFAEMPQHDRYKLLCAAVVPRPIALVTSLDEAGRVNAAPFSFFNVFSEEPPLVVLGLQSKANGGPKDTTRNIRRGGGFVVHLVDEALAEAMNVCAVDFPPESSEIEAAKLDLIPSVEVPVPRIATAPFALECRSEIVLSFGPERDLAVGRVLHFHARAGLVDPISLRVDFEAYHPVGRLFGDLYTRQRDVFTLKRQAFAEWQAHQDAGP